MRVVPMSVATMLAAMVALTACATPNRLSDPAETEVLTFAETSPGGQAVDTTWAEEVERVSNGRIQVEFKYEWRAGEPQYEVGTVRDVQAGKVDMVGVGARVFDRIGYRGFQALLAPFLIDSYELEAKVFDKGIPDQMLAGMDQEGLVGLGILPGPMRRVVGLNDAFTTVKAFKGQQIAMNDSALTEETLAALGATPRARAAGSDLKYDAVEFQLSSVRGFESQVDSIAANVNLWPRPQVLLISKARFDELSPEDQQILRTVTESLRAGTLEDLGAEDQEALKVLCRSDIRFPVAKPADLRALEAAVSSVHQGLRADPDTARWVDEIASLKAAVAAPPEVANCDKAKQSSQAAAGIPDGTYTRTITQADLDQLGITGKADDGGVYPLGEWTLVFDNGLITKSSSDPTDVATYTYSIFRDRIHVEGGVTMEATFIYEDGKLLFTDMTFPGCDDCYNPDGSLLSFGGDAVAFGTVPKPWVRQP